MVYTWIEVPVVAGWFGYQLGREQKLTQSALEFDVTVLRRLLENSKLTLNLSLPLHNIHSQASYYASLLKLLLTMKRRGYKEYKIVGGVAIE
jgi:hypothetical protein